MYAPVLAPESRPADAVLAVEAQMLRADGPLYVNGRYYASEADAALARRHLAERIVLRAAGLTPRQRAA